MPSVFLVVLLLLGCSDSFTFDGNIIDFAVVNSTLYIAADDKLYQMNSSLSVERLKDTSNTTHHNRLKILVPFEKNNTLFTCGDRSCGYCVVHDLNDISKIIHEEFINVASINPEDSSLGFLVDLEDGQESTYLLAGAFQREEKLRNCNSEGYLLTLRSTKDSQTGGIFSAIGEQGTPFIGTRRKDVVEFVKGFQLDSRIYVFLNLRQNKTLSPVRVRLLWMDAKVNKRNTLSSLGGVTLQCCEDKSRALLVSSTGAHGSSQQLWAGVFTAGNDRVPVNTALAIFSLTQIITNGGSTNKDSDFCLSCTGQNTEQIQPVAVNPTAVVFRYSWMTSVASVTLGSWLVYFVGTGDGQLIKIAVDKALKTTCPIVLYKADDDRKISKMVLDPGDEKHIYVALENQIRKVGVAQCERYESLTSCWNAQDPHCGWCASQNRCMFRDECSGSLWFSIPDGSVQKKMFSFQVDLSPSKEEVTVNVMAHLNEQHTGRPAFSCAFTTEQGNLCVGSGSVSPSHSCSCSFSTEKLPAAGLRVRVQISLGDQQVSEDWTLRNCSALVGEPTAGLCSDCVTAGCLWSHHTCTWMSKPPRLNQTEATCQSYPSGQNISEPKIISVDPNEISFYGKNNVTLKGENLDQVTKIRIRDKMDCNPKESPVWNRSNHSLTFHVPSASKGVVTVCTVVPGGKCHGSAEIAYRSLPSCSSLSPNSTWASGGRIIRILGSNLQFVDGVEHDGNQQTLNMNASSNGIGWYQTPASGDETVKGVRLKVANKTINCPPLTYHADPEFTSFTATPTGDDLRITIKKKADKMNIGPEELTIWAMDHRCENIIVETGKNIGEDSVVCEISNEANAKIQTVKIILGYRTYEVDGAHSFMYLILLILCIIPLIIVGVVWIYRVKQRNLSEQMNERLELLENDIRNEIRQGFVDMQTEKSDLTENVGAIPFLDYKHFASRIFFPEAGAATSSFLKDLGQDSVKVHTDESCQALSRLIQEQFFLTSFIHTLEEQKNFTIKDKCTVASLLTLALHSDLPYLTEVMEDLLRTLMDLSSNAQPKLMLRRTESIVEKLLTNWMSICLYGFLRESVGQPLYLLVSALNQQISKGPVDSVTEKALYTLNEDGLLWQAQDFNTLKLKVSYAVVSMGEGSAPLEVSVLDCDTVEQVKEKILAAFRSKFGFPYSGKLGDINITYEKAGGCVLLQEVDSTSQVLGEVTMLNTLRHYQVPDGAPVKVTLKEAHAPLSSQVSLKDDKNFSIKYFHLIDPDIDHDLRKHPERKKLKLKEVYLTKLLSTKVAVHSFVENLFRTIWGTANSRVPPAVKYFFDFLDTQAENKKITDPDVLHIWKTNSLPLRFWVNILKNPQFVFDMEKTPQLDSCLSVIAQAFMDSFSLAENQLGKHAPTNKLLYAKDIPQYKQEVKAYYKQVRDMLGFTGPEFKVFLQEESKKHENEFNESAALREIYRYMQRYFTEIQEKLEQNGASSDLKEQLQKVKDLFNSHKSCSWD
ncbi:plexin-C1 [Megalops cyprinoides]|uniref:plexin-C1 n=1 Tax=Megalops cyprinoides TaxID=118141 RepID=UPI0018651256|nr:plexin-C1 [Megalops cyprinoides]